MIGASKFFCPFLLSALFAVMMSSERAAAAFTVKPEPGSVEFLAVGKPGFLKIHGKNATIIGSADLKEGHLFGKFVVDLNQFQTGIDLRDEHMKKKYLETEKFPNATLEIKKMGLNSKDSVDVDFSGDLTLHGVTRSIAGKASVSYQTGGKQAHVKASMKFHISDYNIAIPEYLGVKVADEVTVSTDFTAVSK